MVDSILFPKRLFEKHAGFGLDIGSSSIKVTYITNETDGVRVHFVKFNKDNLDEALTFIKEKCAGGIEPGALMYACGIGSSLNRDHISQVLSIRLDMAPESDSGLEAWQFLFHHAPWESLVYPPSQSAVDYGSASAKQMAGLYSNISQGRLTPWGYMSDVEGNDAAVRAFTMPQTVQYPILMVGIGSGYFLGVMQSNGSFESCCNINGSAGRTFLGLGSLLTGVKDFSELAELAKQGNGARVDQWMNSMGLKEDGDMYKPNDLKLFAFGHAVGKGIEDFKKEDLAAAILSLIIQSTVNEAYFWAAHHKIQQVFFVAGFSCSTEHIREEIVKEFNMRRFANSLGHICDCRIMKQGAFLGAMGSLMKNLNVISS